MMQIPGHARYIENSSVNLKKNIKNMRLMINNYEMQSLKKVYKNIFRKSIKIFNKNTYREK
jgi:hypothetical protein